MRSRKYTVKLVALDLPLALFTFSAALGVWPAYDRNLSWNTLIALVAGLLLYALISRLAVSHSRWRAIAILIVLASALLALYFITQYAHFGHPMKVRAIGRLVAFLGQIIPPAVLWAPMANSVAAFLEGVLFLALALALSEKRPAWRASGIVAAGLIALALLMSESRGAWVAVLVTSALWPALHWRPARALAIVGAALALGLAVYVVARGDITAMENIPIVGRIVASVFMRPDRLFVYRNSVYLIQDFPLTGIGLGEQFAMVLSRYALLLRHPFLSISHNLYLQIWLEQGLPGILAWVWLMAALYQAARTHRTSPQPHADLPFQGTWLGLTAIFIHGTTDVRQYEDLWCWLPFFGLLGLNAGILLRRSPSVPQGRRWVLPAAVVGVSLIAVIVSLHPLPATWHANLGCVFQARADLSPSLNDGQRASLRQQAMDHYRRALQIAPHDRTARQRLGLMLIDEGQFHQAVEHLEVAWQADPDNTTTHKALGLAYVWVGELEKARPLLQDVPDIVEELNVWGWWRGTQQQTEQSLNAYRMSLLLEPDQPELREMLDQLEGRSVP